MNLHALVLYLFLFPIAAPAAEKISPITFEVSFSHEARALPFTGRVILFLSKDTEGEPRRTHGWLSRSPIFSADVTDWKPDTSLTLANLHGFPYALAELPAAEYSIQAVMHTNLDEPHGGTAPGNIYSKPVTQSLDPAKTTVVKVALDKVVKSKDKPLRTPNAKEVKVRSRLLSDFHRRDIFMRAIVSLPSAYDENPTRRFPTIYVIPGFGGDHRQATMAASMLGGSDTPFVRIGLDPTCPLGHHVFADSANNGPCGQALVEEFIPYLEKNFRLIPDAHARFLNGHSSGGWSSLWLQVAYPDYFGGTWSTSPDPVDFHDFTGVNLYDPSANYFRLAPGVAANDPAPNPYSKARGEKRPIMRRDGKVLLWMQDFVTMEDVIGPGGQMHSFEAVFSPRGAHGQPKLLFDRQTGKIDAAVVEQWRRYDIREKLHREWKTLGPKLKGKIHILVGGADNFYLEGAVKRLEKELKELGSDATITIEPGKDHGTVMFTSSYRKMIDQMSEKFAAWQAATSRNAQ